jgi:hypothetical protein
MAAEYRSKLPSAQHLAQQKYTLGNLAAEHENSTGR